MTSNQGTSNIVLSDVEYRVVGKRPVRPDGVDKVTGRAQYGADVNLAGLLHGKVLRSPHAHARIVSIDTSRAEAVPGVRAVVTAKDLPFAGFSKEELGGDYLRSQVRQRPTCWPVTRHCSRAIPWRRWRRSTRTWPRKRRS